MLGPVDLSKYFYRNTRIIGMQTSGLTHADSLAQTPYNVNCLNWTVGHILLNRSNTMRELGQDSSFGELARYARESDPIVEDGPGVVPLPELLQRLDESQKTLREVFDTVSDQVWAAPDDDGVTLAQRVFFFYFHDTYHTGQTDLLRQVAGKNDSII